MSKYWKWFLTALSVFIVVCLMGLFCSLAGGVQWGTESAGLAALLTLLCASVGFVVALLALLTAESA